MGCSCQRLQPPGFKPWRVRVAFSTRGRVSPAVRSTFPRRQSEFAPHGKAQKGWPVFGNRLVIRETLERGIMKIRNRIVETRTVLARDLVPNPKNWRRHPKAQADALRRVLRETGNAYALLTRSPPHN